ncbi:hypothetical protein EVAR_22897_1 [Eumeta japonica]|uniref:Uncharacterized protein n=1 Tax=Eumeta variegata TaxID=151549 RepID=A0A4C1UVF4_EUMVA|nr:hypothetical protein EVAR_22897_1 [Eumeta japonica]
MPGKRSGPPLVELKWYIMGEAVSSSGHAAPDAGTSSWGMSRRKAENEEIRNRAFSRRVGRFGADVSAFSYALSTRSTLAPRYEEAGRLYRVRGRIYRRSLKAINARPASDGRVAVSEPAGEICE